MILPSFETKQSPKHIPINTENNKSERIKNTVKKTIITFINNIDTRSQEASSVKNQLQQKINSQLGELVDLILGNQWNHFSSSIQGTISNTSGEVQKRIRNYDTELQHIKEGSTEERIHITSENKKIMRQDYICESQSEASNKTIEVIINLIKKGEILTAAPKILYHPNGHKKRKNDHHAQLPHFNYEIQTNATTYRGHICWMYRTHYKWFK